MAPEGVLGGEPARVCVLELRMKETSRRQQIGVAGRVAVDDVVQQANVAISGNGGILEVRVGSATGNILASQKIAGTPQQGGGGGFGGFGGSRGWQSQMTAKYGSLTQNPAFWASISPNSYLAGISGPVQLDHSTTDEEVPFEFSQSLDQALLDAGKTVEFYSYPGDNHNIANNFGLAMQRSIAFFDKYVKGTG